MKVVYDLCYLLLIGCLCWLSFNSGVQHANESMKQKEQTSLCYDTPKYEAFVSHKGGFVRCFMQQKEYPHRVRGSHIEGEE